MTSVVRDRTFAVTASDGVRLEGILTLSDTLSVSRTVVLYLPNPNHTTQRTAHIRQAICSRMSERAPVIISFSYRGLHTSEGTFDFFNPKQHSIDDTLLVLHNAYAILRTSMITVSDTSRVVIVADGLSCFLAKQLITRATYSFSHVVCLQTIPDRIEHMFTNSYVLQYKRIQSTFRFVTFAKLRHDVAREFQKLQTPCGTPLFSAVRGGTLLQNRDTVTAYRTSLQTWVTFMKSKHPHMFQTHELALDLGVHYYFQLCTHTPNHKQNHSIWKMLACPTQNTTLQIHITDKWGPNNSMYDVDMCLSRLCQWYTTVKKVFGHVCVDIGEHTYTYNYTHEQSSKNVRRTLLCPFGTSIHTANAYMALSTSCLPIDNWLFIFDHFPTCVKTHSIRKLINLPNNIKKPIIILSHDFELPTIISGRPVCTMNIRSTIQQTVSITIALVHMSNGKCTTLADMYEFDTYTNNTIQTVRMLLPYTHTTIGKHTAILIGIRRCRSILTYVQNWVCDTSSSIDVSSVWIDFPVLKEALPEENNESSFQFR